MYLPRTLPSICQQILARRAQVASGNTAGIKKGSDTGVGKDATHTDVLLELVVGQRGASGNREVGVRQRIVKVTIGVRDRTENALGTSCVIEIQTRSARFRGHIPDSTYEKYRELPMVQMWSFSYKSAAMRTRY